MSAFHSLDHYRAKSGQYELLPIRFEPLDGDTVVITNAIGEFIKLPRPKLQALVGHSLPPTDEAYPLLRAGHFLKEAGDDASLQLLALKTRTKLQRLKNFTSLHLFVVTLRCDHSCPYCQVSRQSEDREAFDMSRETADRAIGMVFTSPNPAIKIEFQGGEPLLNFELIRYVVERAEAINRAEQRDLQFVITTTLSLATNEMLEFCRDHKIYLSSSLDGPADLHNKNRPRPGRDSHERFADGLKRARDIVGYDSVSALMTTSPSSLPRIREIIDEYVSHGFDGIFLRALSPYGFALKTKSFQAYNMERWLEFYREGMDYIIGLNKRGVPFAEHFSALVLTKMLSANDPGYTDLMSPAGLGVAAVVFNYDGDVYASDESRMLKEMGDASFRLGNVHSNSYQEIFGSETLLTALEDSFPQSVPMCCDCAFEPWCGADPVYHHAMYGDVVGRKPESEFCGRMMGVIKYLLEAMEDKENRQIFTKWVTRC
jgi:uncharacterized protein